MRKLSKLPLTISSILVIVSFIIIIASLEKFADAILQPINPLIQLQNQENSKKDGVSEDDLLASIEKQKQSSAMMVRNSKFSHKIKKFKEEASKNGTVPIIVKVRATYQPEGKIANAVERIAQQKVIKEVQKELISGLRYVPSSLKQYDSIPFIAVRVDSAGLDQLEDSSEVLDVFEDKPVRLAVAESIMVVGAPRAWEAGYTGSGKAIAVLDTGVDKDHPYLAGKVVAEGCFSTTDANKGYTSLCPGNGQPTTAPNSGRPCEIDGQTCEHGTQVAGTAAGASGVAKDAQIISVKVATFASNDTDCSACLLALSSDIVSALQYVKSLRTTYNIAAANISLSTEIPDLYDSFCDNKYEPLKTEIDELKSYGIAVIVPAGNNGESQKVGYPACISSAISVGASNDGSETGFPLDTVWDNSNISSFLNLLSPGARIIAPIPGGGTNQGYGTSLASAHVAGAWALLSQKYPTKPYSETVWVDDSLPAGAIPLTKEGDSWTWVSENPTPYSGSSSHVSNIASGMHEHYFEGATQTLQVNAGDKLYAYAYIDPLNIPEEIMLEWNDGNWEHRAYWGANKLAWGADGTGARRYMGVIPEAGKWVRLEVPASMVNLEGSVLNGMAFTLFGGRVTWDKAGKATDGVQEFLARLRHSGVNITDSRTGNTIPRIRIDSALHHTLNIPTDRWKGEYFNNTTLSNNPSMVRDDGNGFLEFDWGVSAPCTTCGIGSDNFSGRWTRTVNLTTGNYKFSVTANDGIKFYIDGQEKLNQWSDQQQATTYIVDVNLTEGNHQLKIEFYEKTGNARVGLTWTNTCISSVAADRWKGEYFNNRELTGSPLMVRDDGIGFLGMNFGGQSPSSSCGLGAENFSARWTRTVNMPAGNYQFSVTGDDGVRLYIDGQLIIDKWINQGATTYTADKTLAAGNHEIKLEYYQFSGPSVASVSWARPCIPDVPSDKWKGEYFNNINLSGEPVMIRDHGSGFIDENFHGINPGATCAMGNENFSIRWTRSIYFSVGSYRFSVTGDDGVRLYIDGQLKIDQWISQAPTTYNVNVDLSAGNHEIKLEYFQGGGDAKARLTWDPVNSGCYQNVSADRWKGEYFNNVYLLGSPMMVRDDGNSSLNLNWGDGSPSSTCNIFPDYFSTRWTRTAYFAESTYRFTTWGDNGIRLYIDGQLKIDRWVNNVETNTVDVALSAGNHEVRLELFETWGGAGASISWTPVCHYAVSADRWKGEYFTNASLSGSPAMVRDDGAGILNFNWGDGGPSSTCGFGGDYFSTRWTRRMYFDPGTYRFITFGDNGVRLFVDDNIKIDRWSETVDTNKVEVQLNGWHNIRFEFFETFGGAAASLNWESCYWTEVRRHEPDGGYYCEYVYQQYWCGNELIWEQQIDRICPN